MFLKQFLESMYRDSSPRIPMKKFRKLQMGMSMDEVKNIETGNLVYCDDDNLSEDSVRIICYCYHESKLPYDLYLYFHKDRLFKAYLVHHMAQSELGANYTQILARLCKKYGAFKDSRVEWSNVYYKKDFELGKPGAVQTILAENHAKVSKVWIDDGIVVVFSNFRSEKTTELRVVFFDKDMLGDPFLKAC